MRKIINLDEYGAAQRSQLAHPAARPLLLTVSPGTPLASPQGATIGNRSTAALSGYCARGQMPIYFRVQGGSLTAGQTPFVLMHGGLMTTATTYSDGVVNPS
jgi:hypothetical protein